MNNAVKPQRTKRLKLDVAFILAFLSGSYRDFHLFNFIYDFTNTCNVFHWFWWYKIWSILNYISHYMINQIGPVKYRKISLLSRLKISLKVSIIKEVLENCRICQRNSATHSIKSTRATTGAIWSYVWVKCYKRRADGYRICTRAAVASSAVETKARILSCVTSCLFWCCLATCISCSSTFPCHLCPTHHY